MNTDFVLLYGIMWAQHESMDAREELVRALHSDGPEVVLLASTLLGSESGLCLNSDSVKSLE
jgi:hypothetical protein